MDKHCDNTDSNEPEASKGKSGEGKVDSELKKQLSGDSDVSTLGEEISVTDQSNTLKQIATNLDIGENDEDEEDIEDDDEDIEDEDDDEDVDETLEEEEEEEEEQGEVMLDEEHDEDEEDDLDYSPSPHRKNEADTTETDTDYSDKEDFPTEGLLKELHFLNASCERPLLKRNSSSQLHKTLKKQRKLDFSYPSQNAKDSGGTGKGEGRRMSLRKRERSDTQSPNKLFHVNAEGGQKKAKSDVAIAPGKSQSKEYGSDQELEASEEANDEDEEDEGVLTIVAQDEQPRKRKNTPSPTRTKKRGRGVESGEVPQEVIELIQSGIDEVLEEKAERTHLTAIHVKNIIKNVMTDENVVAMVRNTVVELHGDDMGVSAVYEPTLTRAKTKELMEQQAAGGRGSIWAGLSSHTYGSTTTLNPETHALATVDFPDEDESDEYHPECDDQLHSDEESQFSAGLTSEGGSPTTPRTPASYTSTPTSAQSLVTPRSAGDMGTPSSQHLSVFKLPNVQKSTVQRVLNFDKEEVVSQRTRSKLPLTETSLEFLEMAFMPPDVTKDMYETEMDDGDWKTFLIDFIHPLKSCEGGEEEEDPEYNILEDAEDAQDLREEMRGDRAVQISKKEIQQLMTELLDTLDGDAGPPLRAHLAPLLLPREIYKRTLLKPQICSPDKNEEGGPAPGAIWVEVLTAKFTPVQLEILKCQMVQHVQLLTTSAVMSNGCQHLEDIANGCEQNLEELKQWADASDFKDSFFNTVNLKPALEFSKTLKVTDFNDLNTEKQIKHNGVDLRPDMIEAILQCTAFPYPRLLPTRMFQHPPMRGYNKTIYVPSEDSLIAMGLERYLDSKYRTVKCKRTQHQLLMEALSQTVKNILVTKTLAQANNRLKNIRCRAKDVPSSPVLQYLETGHMDLPAAEAEPLPACVPCPVLDFPESFLGPPFLNFVKKKNGTLKTALHNAARKVAIKSAVVLKARVLESRFHGAGSLQNQLQNVVILQPSDSGESVSLQPPDTVQSLTPYSFIVQSSSKGPLLTVSGQDRGDITVKEFCISELDGELLATSCNPSVPQDGVDCPTTDKANAVCVDSTSTSAGVDGGAAPHSSEHTAGSPVALLSTVDESQILVPTPEESFPGQVVGTGDGDAKILNEKVTDVESKAHDNFYANVDNNEYQESESILESNEGNGKERLPCDDSVDLALETETSARESVVYNNSQKINTGNGKKENLYRDNNHDTGTEFISDQSSSATDIGTESPSKILDKSAEGFSLSQLSVSNSGFHMPSLFTPRKVEDRSGVVSLAGSPDHTPVKSTPTPPRTPNTPLTGLSGVKDSFCSKESPADAPSSSVLKGFPDPVVAQASPASARLQSSPTRSPQPIILVSPIKISELCELNEERELRNMNDSENIDHSKTSPMNKNGTILVEPEVACVSGVLQEPAATTTTTQGSGSITLVTSVYHSPIFTSRVDKVLGSSPSTFNSTPQKAQRPLRKISPAKSYKSPIKTSPMKQVSPILRKYHKYSPKKRNVKRKLSPILPKVSVSQRMRSSSAQRKLAPKPSKSPSTSQDATSSHSKGRSACTTARSAKSLLRGMKHSGDGDLLQLDDDLVTSGSSVSVDCKVSQRSPAHTSHDEFEEYPLEYLDEEEEDEDEEEEEEDIQAEQQREEHLAALLKASSTISLRRGGGGDGLEKRLGDLSHGGRRLSKQQRRLQARMTALATTPDSTTQDKFMAQSYLTRVREALMSREPTAFKKFLFILSEFTENPGRSPLELYNQLSEVLKDYPHLLEEFVSFLLPQQAIAIGKYAQYCAIHRMRDFLEKLELQFGSQPQYIQKIMRQLQVLQARPHLHPEEIKAAITPLLRYPHLVECFTQCFPSQPPPPSLQDDFEDIALDQPGSPDSMENLVLPDDDLHTSPNHCVCVCHAPSSLGGVGEGPQLSPPHGPRTEHCRSCAIRFSEGRVYLQCGKTLRPAKVTYQAVKAKKEEESGKKYDDSSTQHSNLPELFEATTARAKNSTKAKSSQVKELGDNTSTRSKEAITRALASSSVSAVGLTTLGGGVSKSRMSASSEEVCTIENNTSEKRDFVAKSADCDSETDLITNREYSSDNHGSCSSGKKSQTKNTCSVESQDVVAFVPRDDFSITKSTSNFSSKCKDSTFPSSQPRKVNNEDIKLLVHLKVGSHNSSNTSKNLLTKHDRVIDQRRKPSIDAAIITDEIVLQKEHQPAYFCMPRKYSKPDTGKSPNSREELPDVGLLTPPNTTDESICDLPLSDISTSSLIAFNISTVSPIETCNLKTVKQKNTGETSHSPAVVPDSLCSVESGGLGAHTGQAHHVAWTKEEDRAILLTVQQRGASDAVFNDITESLPARDSHEVFERFNTLVSLMMEEADVEESLSISSEDSAVL